MKIKILGTAASEGFPALFCECEACQKARKLGGRNLRTRASTLVDESLLIDFSADTYAHTLMHGLDLTKVTDLIVTHSHPDHLYTADIAAAVPPMAMYDRERFLRVYGNDAVERKFYEVFDRVHDYQKVCGFTRLQDFGRYSIGKYTVTALPAAHVKAEDCFLYVVQDGHSTLLYGHDTGAIPDKTWQAFENFRFDCVILDCTCGLLEENRFPSHMNFRMNLAVRDRMVAIGCADSNTQFVATHFVHVAAPFQDHYEEVMGEEGFIAAYDGIELVF